jgi:uncharacterized membrane protein
MSASTDPGRVDPGRGPEPPLSGWAAGGIAFAAVMLLLIGAFQIVAGLAAIFEDDFFVVGREYAFDLDVSAWGWLHLILGVLLVLTGMGLFARQAWAGVTAIFLATLSAIANFFFIPYYPFWAIVVIVLDVWVIWALTRPTALRY